MNAPIFVALLFLAVALGGPVVMGLSGLVVAPSRIGPRPATPPWDWGLSVRSALLYALAYNLTFFLQELFLAAPKALLPGVSATLYHNNHGWEGEHPLVPLFQGTGAAAIFLSGLFFAWLVRSGAGRGMANARLFFIWMAFQGLFQSLIQVVIGSVVPANDVGTAMDFLGLGETAKLAAAVLALAAMAFVGLWLARPLLALAPTESWTATPGRRARFVLWAAAIPAIVAVLLIVPFRLPRDWIEVLVLPGAVTMMGISWIEAGAWRVTNVRPAGLAARGSVLAPLIALLAVLAFFQLVLRPGVTF